MRRLVAAVLVVLLASPTALAQEPQPDPQPQPQPPEMEPPEPEGAPMPADPEPEIAAAYERAFEALVAGDYDAAAAGFQAVAETSQLPERRATAREMFRLAGRMKLARAGGQATPDGRLVLADQESGRAQFVVATTFGAFYGGFVLLDTFGVDDYRPSIALVTGSTAAGFLGSLFGTRGKDISAGMADAYTVGLWSGLANGLLLAPVIGIEADGSEGDGEVSDNFLTFGLVSMAAGGAAGAYLGSRYQPTSAQARFAGLMTYSGFITAGLGMLVFQPEFSDEDMYLAILALGLDTGLVAGVSIAPKLKWSGSRVTYVGLGQFLGALGGFATVALISGTPDNEDDGTAMAAGVLLGYWGGFALSTHLTRDMAPDSRYAKKPAGGAGAGMLVSPVVLGQDGQGRGIAVAGTF